MSADENDFQHGDREPNLLRKILGRLKQLVNLGGGGGGGSVTLTVSDIEIGAVEVKDSTTDDRVRVMNTVPGVNEYGLVVRVVPGAVTDAEMRAAPIPVSVTGGGGLTDAELRASPVPVSVSGVVAVSEPVSVDDNGGSLTVDGTFLTDAQLRATPVPVSGPLTDAELRATPVPVSGTVSVTEPVSVDDNGASLTTDTLQLPAALVGGRLDANVGAWLGSTAPTVGQKTMANSVPVTIASDQSGVAVTGPLTDAQLRATPVPVSGTVSTKTNLTPASPTAASVGVASAQAVASNSSRKGLVLTNTSNATISLGLGAAAVLLSGITLFPGDSFSMDETSFYTGAINAIASAAASNLAIQEFST